MTSSPSVDGYRGGGGGQGSGGSMSGGVCGNGISLPTVLMTAAPGSAGLYAARMGRCSRI